MSDKIEFNGTVSAARGNGHFVVEICDDCFVNKSMEISCTLSGKMRKNGIRVVEGDSVKIEVSAYDPTKGRIVFRSK